MGGWPVLLSLLVILLPQLLGQFQQQEDSGCGGARQCLVITQCPALLDLLKQVKSGMAGPAAKREIFSNHCGFQDTLPMVCCQTGQAGSTPSIVRAIVASVRTTTTTTSTTTSTTSITTTTTTTATTTTVTTTRRTTTNIKPTTEEGTTLEFTNVLNEKQGSPGRIDPGLTTPFTTTVTTPATETPALRTAPDFSSLNSLQCGTRTALTLRITFGQTAAEGQFPWAASLQYRRRPGGRAVPLCGGALVSQRHVLTAAHCDSSQSGYRLSSVRLGQVDISAAVSLPGVEVDVESVLRHPDYQQTPVAINDIALILLSRPLVFTDQIRPACLHHPSPSLLSSPPAGYTVVGWGRTDTATSSPTLQFTGLLPLAPAQCQEQYSAAAARGQLGPGIPQLDILASQLCAQGEGGTDSCSGDSGGPLLAVVGGRWYLAGVVSFGTQRCDSSLPGVYTRVASYWDWLREVMGPL